MNDIDALALHLTRSFQNLHDDEGRYLFCSSGNHLESDGQII